MSSPFPKIKQARVKYNNPYSGIILRTIHNLERRLDQFKHVERLHMALDGLNSLLLNWPPRFTLDEAYSMCSYYTDFAELGIDDDGPRQPIDDIDPVLPLARKQPSGWITREDRRTRRLGGPRRTIVRRSRRIAHTK